MTFCTQQVLTEGNELLCLYAVGDGHSERSFALQVAQVAGVPAESMDTDIMCAHSIRSRSFIVSILWPAVTARAVKTTECLSRNDPILPVAMEHDSEMCVWKLTIGYAQLRFNALAPT